MINAWRFEESPDEQLDAWQGVTDGWTDEEIAQIEALAVDRSHFMQQESWPRWNLSVSERRVERAGYVGRLPVEVVAAPTARHVARQCAAVCGVLCVCAPPETPR